MPEHKIVFKRLQALDGISFRFERRMHVLFVNGMPAHVHTQHYGIVELVTEHKTVQVSAATYWEMIYDDIVPTPLSAGMILAKYDELVGKLSGWFTTS
ncbi:hypothetical protein ccbrp13_63140 [Ktedonobacteria bacterium brp13]|nr:hypothetical protein ccbrp13_63140 [Ktedonobacteria bacterium brp13]